MVHHDSHHHHHHEHHSHGQEPLTEHEKELVAQLKAEIVPLIREDAALRLWANDHTYVRYLRARGWNLHKASKMIHASIEWRKEYKPHLIRWSQVKHESVTGKQMIYPCTDKNGRPIVLMRPRLENTKEQESQIRFLMYNLELASRMADASQVGKMCWLLDFEGYAYANAPPLKVSIHCNHILQHHFPERLGLAVCYHSPMLFSMTWKAVSPFIDPITKEKIKFVDKGAKEAAEMEEKFYMEQMEDAVGGGHKGFAFNLEEYEKLMLKHDEELEAALKAMEEEVQREKAQLAAQSDTSMANTVGSAPVVEGLSASTTTNVPSTITHVASNDLVADVKALEQGVAKVAVSEQPAAPSTAAAVPAS